MVSPIWVSAVEVGRPSPRWGPRHQARKRAVVRPQGGGFSDPRRCSGHRAPSALSGVGRSMSRSARTVAPDHTPARARPLVRSRRPHSTGAMGEARVRTPGFEPGSRAWKALVIPLDYVRVCPADAKRILNPSSPACAYRLTAIHCVGAVRQRCLTRSHQPHTATPPRPTPRPATGKPDACRWNGSPAEALGRNRYCYTRSPSMLLSDDV